MPSSLANACELIFITVWEIQIAREGIATQILSIPLRYMHTPMEVVDLRDIEQGARLLAAFLRTLGEEGEKC